MKGDNLPVLVVMVNHLTAETRHDQLLNKGIVMGCHLRGSMIMLYVNAVNHETIMSSKPIKLFFITVWGADSCNNLLLFRETISARHLLLSSDDVL